jgi:hypothetical protein
MIAMPKRSKEMLIPFGAEDTESTLVAGSGEPF